jgi:hypothetical protein
MHIHTPMHNPSLLIYTPVHIYPGTYIPSCIKTDGSTVNI